MSTTGYNGWTNYATWRVMLEVWNDWDWSERTGEFADVAAVRQYLREGTAEAVTEHGEIAEYALAINYAMAFIEECNWDEMARHIVEDYPELLGGERCRTCEGALDDGEGYDGECGECADRTDSGNIDACPTCGGAPLVNGRCHDSECADCYRDHAE